MSLHWTDFENLCRARNRLVGVLVWWTFAFGTVGFFSGVIYGVISFTGLFGTLLVMGIFLLFGLISGALYCVGSATHSFTLARILKNPIPVVASVHSLRRVRPNKAYLELGLRGGGLVRVVTAEKSGDVVQFPAMGEEFEIWRFGPNKDLFAVPLAPKNLYLGKLMG